MLSEQDKQKIKSLLFTPTWSVLEQVALDMTNEIRARSKTGDSEWDTARKAVADEGEERGIMKFLQRLLDSGQQSI